MTGAGVRWWATAALLTAAVATARPAPDIEITVSREGFSPRTVSLRKGETVRLILSSEDGEHCFALDELRVEKRVVPGRTTSFELTPERTGSFPFYCCVETGEAARIERGELTVTE